MPTLTNKQVNGTLAKLELNKIYLMDCMQGMKKMADSSVDLVLTDPPYGISRQLNCEGGRLGTTAKLNFNFGGWDTLDHEWLNLAIAKTKGWFISFCAKKDVGLYWGALENAGFIAIDALAWQKPDPLPLNAKSRFLNAWEVAVIGKRPGATWNSKYQHNIIKTQAPKGKGRIHPTQKPLSLIEQLIQLTTNPGDTILDPFMGSGTTAVAALNLERNFLGFEIDHEYHKASLQRLKERPIKLI